MRIALISDIHSNIHALEAVEKDIKEQQIDKIFCLGDILNFGAHPKEVLDWVKENCEIVLKGEHDILITEPGEVFISNPFAIQAADWTFDMISDEDFEYIKSLENFYEEPEFILTHDEPSIPGSYQFLTSLRDAKETFTCFDNQFCFYGHTHLQIIFVKDRKTGEVFADQSEKRQINENEQYLISIGSVGQPRDRDPRAGYTIVDFDKNILEMRRVAYDFEKAASDILNAGLPEVFANILKMKRD